jgi:hypothetical protein
MAKLTDEDLERLLRETFADKENLVDRLPQATKRRRPVAPVLLAAAAVFVVLAGILYGVNRDAGVDPAPPVATTDASDNAEIWAAAITTIAQKYEPNQGWQTLNVRNLPAGSEVQQRGSSRPAMSLPDMERIAELVTVAPVRWPSTTVEIDSCADRRIADVAVGDVIDVGDHKQVRTSIMYACNSEYVDTYRVEKQGDTWEVTGTVGTAQRTIPVSKPCAMSGKTPASPRDGC